MDPPHQPASPDHTIATTETQGYSNPGYEAGLEPYNPNLGYYKPYPDASPEVAPVTHQPAAYNPEIPLEKEKTICGIRRNTFWVVVAAILAVIVIVLAGILGAVASGSIKTSGNSAQSTPTSDIATATSSALTSSAARTSTASSASASPTSTDIPTVPGPGGIKVECPAADGLNYTAPGTSKVFKRQCDVNYPGGDSFNITATNMQDCLNACAARADCVAVNWLYTGVQGTGSNYCWVKSFQSMKTTGNDMESAILWQ